MPDAEKRRGVKRPLMLRIVAPTLAVSFGLLFLGGLAAWYLHHLQRESARLMAASLSRIQAAEEIQLDCQRLRNQLAIGLLLDEEPDPAMIRSLHTDVDRWIETARGLATTSEERDLLDRIAGGYGRLFDVISRVSAENPSDNRREAIVRAIGAIAHDEIVQPAEEYRQLIQAMTAAASQDEQTIADRMGLGLLLLGMCGSVAGLLAGYGLARGVRRSLLQMSVPIKDATGALNQVIGPITVSSEEGFEELETALREMSDRVAKVVQQYQAAQLAMTRAERMVAMGQLAAGLAHELRNPLTSMKILIQAGCENDDSATLDRKDLGVLREEVNRLDQIIQNYLDYARPPQLERSEFALRRVVEQSVELVESRAAQMDIRIDCSLPERIVKVDVDAGQIRQVLLNLLLNAVDASPEGGTITLRTHFESEDGLASAPDTEDAPPAWVVIEVADHGPGLPAELDDRIFEPFVSTKEAGTGLGLPTCRRIVEDHGGHIVAANRADGGAVFTVWLPVRAEERPGPKG